MRCALLLMMSLLACAQDRRTVNEPALPAPCAVLEAQLKPGGRPGSRSDQLQIGQMFQLSRAVPDRLRMNVHAVQ